jgi:hypothetical protein
MLHVLLGAEEMSADYKPQMWRFFKDIEKNAGKGRTQTKCTCGRTERNRKSFS